MHHTAAHIPTFIQTLEPYIHKHGYLGLAALLFLEDFGLPLPGETILIAGAFYAGLGQLNVILILIVAFLAAVMGDNVGFLIGKYGGHPLIYRYGKYVFLPPQRIKKAEDFFRRKGGRIVVVARFIEGLRQLNGILAGLSEMAWHKFVAYNAIGAALWVGLWTAAGYFGGSHIETFIHYELYFSIAFGVAIIIYGLRFWLKRRAAKNH